MPWSGRVTCTRSAPPATEGESGMGSEAEAGERNDGTGSLLRGSAPGGVRGRGNVEVHGASLLDGPLETILLFR